MSTDNGNPNESSGDVLADVLEKIAVERNTLSTEKIVASVVMVLITGVCLWAGNSINELTSTVVGLQSDLTHTNKSLGELKSDFREFRVGHRVAANNNAAQIALITERMRADDDREKRDTAKLIELEHRIEQLEKGHRP